MLDLVLLNFVCHHCNALHLLHDQRQIKSVLRKHISIWQISNKLLLYKRFLIGAYMAIQPTWYLGWI